MTLLQGAALTAMTVLFLLGTVGLGVALRPEREDR